MAKRKLMIGPVLTFTGVLHATGILMLESEPPSGGHVTDVL